MADVCGLAAKATVRRVGDVTKRFLRELPAATEAVANMPSDSGFMLGTFAQAIEERIRAVQLHAQQEGAVVDDSQAMQGGLLAILPIDLRHL